MKRFVVVPIVLFVLLLACSRQEEPKPSAVLTGVPDQVLENSVVTLTDKGVLSTYLLAKKVARYEAPDITKVWEIKADFFDHEGKHFSVLVADSGLVREKTRRLTAWGHVVVTYDRGDRFESDSLFWDGEKEHVETDAFVKIFRKDGNMQGYGLETDSEFKRFKIKRQVKGTYTEMPADSVLEKK